MKRHLLFLGTLFLLISCSSSKIASTNSNSKNHVQVLRDHYTFLITEVSTDKTYGLNPKNPVEVGGVHNSEGPLNERRYLNALSGPNGEPISYYRIGSCCPVKSENGFTGTAMLDNYRVTWEGAQDTVSIYINMYDSSKLKAPVGFTIKN